MIGFEDKTINEYDDEINEG